MSVQRPSFDKDKITLIHPDGREEWKEIKGDPALHHYYKWLRCTVIQVIPTTDGREMICDEEGKVRADKEPLTNFKACDLAGLPKEGHWRVVGEVVIQPSGTLK